MAIVSTLVVCGGAASLYVALGLCRSCDYSPRVRPPGVPEAAVWAGGPDGGSYFKCSVDPERGVNPCTVWNDETGALIVSGDFRISGEDRPASADQLKYGWWDGRVIGLTTLGSNQRYVALEPVGNPRPVTVCEAYDALDRLVGKDVAVLGRVDLRMPRRELAQEGCAGGVSRSLLLVDNVPNPPRIASGFLHLSEKSLTEKLAILAATTPLGPDGGTVRNPRFWWGVYGRLERREDGAGALMYSGGMVEHVTVRRP